MSPTDLTPLSNTNSPNNSIDLPSPIHRSYVVDEAKEHSKLDDYDISDWEDCYPRTPQQENGYILWVHFQFFCVRVLLCVLYSVLCVCSLYFSLLPPNKCFYICIHFFVSNKLSNVVSLQFHILFINTEQRALYLRWWIKNQTIQGQCLIGSCYRSPLRTVTNQQWKIHRKHNFCYVVCVCGDVCDWRIDPNIHGFLFGRHFLSFGF